MNTPTPSRNAFNGVRLSLNVKKSPIMAAYARNPPSGRKTTGFPWIFSIIGVKILLINSVIHAMSKTIIVTATMARSLIMFFISYIINYNALCSVPQEALAIICL
ncbi:hypothetical protein ATCV1_z662L [Acanthocystis turfacea chlorella virus 1]|uniref:Uncharacterized protein z662L n=1 Tax=Chlorovirus heliozoae TaxID=322019 RepID=A7K9S2_9PHYC|nr:hypothetical protein ATCV1_z662L [Acanthocystis turfacea chlorella virus 1]ABT16796.1 hypothetical protein ATCV1_z662L [Acanthocystis turfacea chlorella virus 1]